MMVIRDGGGGGCGDDYVGGGGGCGGGDGCSEGGGDGGGGDGGGFDQSGRKGAVLESPQGDGLSHLTPAQAAVTKTRQVSSSSRR